MPDPLTPEPLTIVTHPLVQHKLTLIRDKTTSTFEFRQLLREISQLMTYEATRHLSLAARVVETPLETMQASVLAGRKPAVVSVLRAGNGLLDGVLELVPTARVGFVGLYRDEETLRPVRYYVKLPEQLDQRQTILVDPMLATGRSAAAAVDVLKENGAGDILFLCILAAPEGVAHLAEQHPDVSVVTAALDTRLSEKGYILPGLGDAGDRMYGTR
ncbi:MAG: uracil phosphoribosyltransferase [Pseudomonadota bacterium]